MNKLKNLVFAENITVNEKFKPIMRTKNIAWFFITSNHEKPINLDTNGKGNRRFTVMKT